MRNLNKYLIVGVSFLFAVSAIGIGMWYSHAQTSKVTTKKTVEISDSKKKAAQEEKKNRKEQTENDNSEPKVSLSLDEFYADPEHVFLAETLTDDKIAEIQENLSDYSKEDQQAFGRVNDKWKIQAELNTMFDSPILIGGNLLEANVKSDINEKAVDKLEKKLKTKAFQDYFAITVQDILDNRVRGKITSSSDDVESSDEQQQEQEALEAEKEQEKLEAEEVAKKEQEKLEAEEATKKEQEESEVEEAAQKEQDGLNNNSPAAIAPTDQFDSDDNPDVAVESNEIEETENEETTGILDNPM